MKLGIVIFFGLLALGIIIWMANCALTLVEMDKRDDEMWENLMLEDEKNGNN